MDELSMDELSTANTTSLADGSAPSAASLSDADAARIQANKTKALEKRATRKQQEQQQPPSQLVSPVHQTPVASASQPKTASQQQQQQKPKPARSGGIGDFMVPKEDLVVLSHKNGGGGGAAAADPDSDAALIEEACVASVEDGLTSDSIADILLGKHSWKNGPYGDKRIFRALPQMGRSVLMGRIKAKRDVLAKMAQASAPATKTRRPKLEVAGTRASDDALSAEQQQVLDSVSEGRNIFITGSAGVGKSFILKKVMQQVKDRGDGKGLCVVGMTGTAACLIGGMTLHAFAGMRAQTHIYGSPEAFAASIMRTKKSKERWTRCKVLIIDEVSMLDAQLFQQLDHTARTIKATIKSSARNLPWGGIQLVLCGDFFQLPPIVDKRDRPRVAKEHLPVPYAFKARGWKESIDRCGFTKSVFFAKNDGFNAKNDGFNAKNDGFNAKNDGFGLRNSTIELTVVFRQSNLAFVGLLNRVRRGQQTPEDLQVLRNCKSCGSASDASAERPTILFSTNKPVDEMNERQLRQLGGETHIFKSDDEGSAEGKKMLDQFNMVSKKVELKVGAEVMMTKNVSVTDGLVNGARGVVVGFGNGQSGPQHSKSLLPIVKFHGMTEPQVVGTEKFQAFLAGAEAATRSQIPLKLAWAISIHKSQGVSISHVKVSLANIFQQGQAYVALSRATTLAGLVVDGVPLPHDLNNVKKTFNTSIEVEQYYASFRREPISDAVGGAAQKQKEFSQLDGSRWHLDGSRSQSMQRHAAGAPPSAMVTSFAQQAQQQQHDRRQTLPQCECSPKAAARTSAKMHSLSQPRAPIAPSAAGRGSEDVKDPISSQPVPMQQDRRPLHQTQPQQQPRRTQYGIRWKQQPNSDMEEPRQREELREQRRLKAEEQKRKWHSEHTQKQPTHAPAGLAELQQQQQQQQQTAPLPLGDEDGIAQKKQKRLQLQAEKRQQWQQAHQQPAAQPVAGFVNAAAVQQQPPPPQTWGFS